jgi:hypothetical protein
MYLHRDDLKKMLEVLEKFPSVEVVNVECDNSSGIGAHTTMKLETQIVGVPGTFEVVISSVENW